MFVSAFRAGGARCLNFLRPVVALKQPKATITGKTARGEPIQRPAPFPYEEVPYNSFTAMFDSTLWRFDENSKVIVVEGPPAVGKTAFAKALAEELECRHFPEVTMDNYYINAYGYDLRQLDPLLPESTRSFDINKFHQDPFHRRCCYFQHGMYNLRYSQYVDALAHIMNSGEGVVLERSPYSDYVFAEAMRKEGYLSKPALDGYYVLEDHTIHEILRPHLIIYLDIPVSKVLENMAERKIVSKALTPSYLTNLEKIYKENYLKKASTHSELMIYDWSDGGDVEAVIEDIERIDFDEFESYKLNPKMKDWRPITEWDFCIHRMEYSSRKISLMQNFDVPLLDIPELEVTAEDWKLYQEIWENAPGQKYAKGFNPDMGDKGIWYRTKVERRPHYIYN